MAFQVFVILLAEGYRQEREKVKMEYILIQTLISFSFNQALTPCINSCDLRFNKTVFNWTICQLLTEKHNGMKIFKDI